MIVASILLVEFMRGFTLSFAGFMALKHVFFRETKKFFCFSVCSGAIFSFVLLITYLISGVFWLDVETFSILLVLSGWLLLTIRSWDSFLATALAVVFVKGITSNFELILFAGIKVIVPNGSNTIWLNFLGYALVYVFTVGFLFLLQKLAANKEKEPLSLWNMILLAGIVSVVAILIKIYFTRSDMSDVNPNAIIPVFITFLFVVASVIVNFH